MNSFVSRVTICTVVIAVLLNLLLPQLLGSVGNLGINEPIMNEMMEMLVMHKQTPVSSSIIVALIVLISVSLSASIC